MSSRVRARPGRAAFEGLDRTLGHGVRREHGAGHVRARLAVTTSSARVAPLEGVATYARRAARSPSRSRTRRGRHATPGGGRRASTPRPSQGPRGARLGRPPRACSPGRRRERKKVHRKPAASGERRIATPTRSRLGRVVRSTRTGAGSSSARARVFWCSRRSRARSSEARRGGVRRALEGSQAGDATDVTLPPADGPGVGGRRCGTTEGRGAGSRGSGVRQRARHGDARGNRGGGGASARLRRATMPMERGKKRTRPEGGMKMHLHSDRLSCPEA